MFTLAAVLLLAAFSLANAATVVSIVGDEDALGTVTSVGGSLPSGPFDNRSPSEAAALDGAKNTDMATGAAGIALDNTYLHSFLLPPGLTIMSAILELGIGGLETNDVNPGTSGLGEDALYIDGVLVPEAFAGVDQGPVGYGILRIELPSTIFNLLEDGASAVFIDLNSNAGFGPSSRVEPVYYDFSRLTTTAVPEASTALIMSAALGTLLLLRHSKQR